LIIGRIIIARPYAQNALPAFKLWIAVQTTHAIFGPNCYLTRRPSNPVVGEGLLLSSYRISHSRLKEKFLQYLMTTKNYEFRLTGTSPDGEVAITLPYIHRWTGIYQKSVLEKFYALENWMKDNPGMVTMFTLTTYQGSKSRLNDGSFSHKVIGKDLTIEDCFGLLKESRAKLLNVLRNRYNGINYVWASNLTKPVSLTVISLCSENSRKKNKRPSNSYGVINTVRDLSIGELI
jgi:hypothetical protein